MKHLLALIIISVLVLQTTQQGGGGGGGGGGGSGGGGSSGDGGGRNIRNCQQECANQPENEISSCVDACEQDKSHTAAIAISVIVGSIVIIGGITCFCCLDSTKGKIKQYLYKRDLLKTINKPLKSSLETLLQQNIRFRIFIRENYKWFSFKLLKISANLDKKRQEITFIMTGEDEFGIWSSSGFIVEDNQEQYHLQMFKEYNSLITAGQKGSFRFLVYQGQAKLNNSLFQGKWWYIGYENSQQYSGEWHLQCCKQIEML